MSEQKITQSLNEMYHFYIMNDWDDAMSFQDYVQFCQDKGIVLKETEEVFNSDTRPAKEVSASQSN